MFVGGCEKKAEGFWKVKQTWILRCEDLYWNDDARGFVIGGI